MKIPIYAKRLSKYFATSVIALSLDLFLLYTLTEFIGIFYLLAAGISFSVAHSMNYIMQKTWGFKGTKSSIMKSYIYFFCFGVFGIFMTIFLLAIFVEKFEINYILGRIIVAFITGGFSFIFNYMITFGMAHEVFGRKSKHI